MLQQGFNESLEAWQQQGRDAAAAAEDARTRATGESRTPGIWLGWGDAFLACMQAQGWVRTSDPL